MSPKIVNRPSSNMSSTSLSVSIHERRCRWKFGSGTDFKPMIFDMVDLSQKFLYHGLALVVGNWRKDGDSIGYSKLVGHVEVCITMGHRFVPSCIHRMEA
jgi:hypothetical protein